VPTIISRTQSSSHHSKPGSASLAQDDNGKTSTKRKVNKDKSNNVKQQQVVLGNNCKTIKQCEAAAGCFRK